MDLVVFENNKPWVIDEFREGRFDYVELASDVAETKFFCRLSRVLGLTPPGYELSLLRSLTSGCTADDAVLNLGPDQSSKSLGSGTRRTNKRLLGVCTSDQPGRA